MEISLISQRLRADDLITELEVDPVWPPDVVRLELRKKEQPFRVLEPTIAVAVVTSAGAGLVALITGVFQIARRSNNGVVVIQDRHGRRVEAPASVSRQRLEELVEVVKGMEDPRIELP
jgi:hypothetical protein